jgi:hypothetical protein
VRLAGAQQSRHGRAQTDDPFEPLALIREDRARRRIRVRASRKPSQLVHQASSRPWILGAHLDKLHVAALPAAGKARHDKVDAVMSDYVKVFDPPPKGHPEEPSKLCRKKLEKCSSDVCKQIIAFGAKMPGEALACMPAEMFK